MLILYQTYDITLSTTYFHIGTTFLVLRNGKAPSPVFCGGLVQINNDLARARCAVKTSKP